MLKQIRIFFGSVVEIPKTVLFTTKMLVVKTETYRQVPPPELPVYIFSRFLTPTPLPSVNLTNF